jgi:hypothetical protein
MYYWVITTNVHNIAPIYVSTAMVGLRHFFSFLTYTQSVGLLVRVIRPSQDSYLHTEQHKHRINAHTNVHALRKI